MSLCVPIFAAALLPLTLALARPFSLSLGVPPLAGCVSSYVPLACAYWQRPRQQQAFLSTSPSDMRLWDFPRNELRGVQFVILNGNNAEGRIVDVFPLAWASARATPV